MMSKGDYESRQKMEKKDNERKKNILILIHQYLINIGFQDSAYKLNEESNLVEIIELPKHKHFIACQFHPEFKSRPTRPHPLFVSFVHEAIKSK